jgi:hypothetical protein
MEPLDYNTLWPGSRQCPSCISGISGTSGISGKGLNTGSKAVTARKGYDADLYEGQEVLKFLRNSYFIPTNA